MWTYTNPDELYHFGVLGMRWHMRKAAVKGQAYEYKSHGQKKYQKKVNKFAYKNEGKTLDLKQEKKFDKLKDKLEIYKLRDQSRVKYSKARHIGETVLQNVTFGLLGSGAYNKYRNAGYDGLKSVLHLIYNPVSVIHAPIAEYNHFKKQVQNNKK